MDFPEKDEFVVCKVNQILGYGVFAELLEYDNARGFIHISNVSSSWVKNIRNLVKINQVRVAKVLNVDKEKKQIDLSFSRISPQMEKQKMTEFRQVNREEKLIEILAKQEKKKFDVVWDEVAEPLIEEFGSLHKSLEKIALGENFEKLIKKEWVKPLQDLVDKNIVVSKKCLRGIVKVKTTSENGVEDIKKLFSETQEKNCSIIYNGAGTYQLSFSGTTYKEAEKILKEKIEQLEKNAKKLNIDFSFEQEEKQKKQ